MNKITNKLESLFELDMEKPRYTIFREEEILNEGLILKGLLAYI